MPVSWPSPFHAIRRCWLCFPPAFRVACYRLLLRFSKWWYGNDYPYQQETPFGIYIKWGSITRGHYRVREGEAAALQLVEDHTNVPAPRLIDYVKTNNATYLVMTKIPGQQAYSALASMNENQRKSLSVELQSAVSQLRRIPNPFKHAICNAVGGQVKDARIWKDYAGPFFDEAEFNAYNCQRAAYMKTELTHVLSRQHRLFFSHADLSTTNVMVKDGKFSGIIDFEFAGWWPEYWEYTKALYIREERHMWKDVIEGIFTEDYSQELWAEEKLWAVTPPF